MKKNIFKKMAAGVLVAAMAFSLSACGGNDASTGREDAGSSVDSSDKGPITVGFSQVGAESDWRTANTESMKSTFSEANGYKLIFDDAQQKQENQLSAIRNFIQQDVDYIVLAPVTETGWDTVLQEAKDAGVPVIIVDRMVDVKNDDLYTAWVGSDFELEGKKAAAYLKAYNEAKKKEAGTKIVDIQGTIGASAQIGRTKGLEDGVTANGWKLLDKTTGEFTQAKGQEVMESFLKKYKKDIDVVYCENDNEAFGAIDAIKAAGYSVGADGDMMIFSFDSTKAGLNDVLSGQITLNTECNPLHGPRVEKIIQQLESGQTPEKTAYVDEEMFAHDDTVKSVMVDGKEYPVTVVTDDVIAQRKY